MEKIGCPTYLSTDKEYLIVVDAEIEDDHDLTLDSNSLWEQLQHVMKAIKFWCGDNEILNNTTPKIFPPSHQSCK